MRVRSIARKHAARDGRTLRISVAPFGGGILAMTPISMISPHLAVRSSGDSRRRRFGTNRSLGCIVAGCNWDAARIAIVAPHPRCQYRGRDPNTCDAAILSFTPHKWLGTDPAGHLFDGLTYLLQAAQEWQCQRDLGLQLVGYQVQVYAMDSVFLRARSLFEFFTGKGPNYCHVRCLFGLTDQLTYARYTSQLGGPKSSWKHVLHDGSIHIQDRDNPVRLEARDGGLTRDLNGMPADIAEGILDVWNIFERELGRSRDGQLLRMAQACREEAKQAAGNVHDRVAQRAAGYGNKAGSKLTKLF